MYDNLGGQPGLPRPPLHPQQNPFGNAFSGAGSGLIRGGLGAYGEKILGSSSEYVQSNVSSIPRLWILKLHLWFFCHVVTERMMGQSLFLLSSYVIVSVSFFCYLLLSGLIPLLGPLDMFFFWFQKFVDLFVFQTCNGLQGKAPWHLIWSNEAVTLLMLCHWVVEIWCWGSSTCLWPWICPFAFFVTQRLSG